MVEVGADEFVGDVVPHAELDLLAVEQHHAAVEGQGDVGGQGVQQAGFAAAGFACGEQVAVDDPDGYGLAEFVAADVDRVEHGQHRPGRDGAGCGCGAGHDGGSPLPEGKGTSGPVVMPWPEGPVAGCGCQPGRPGKVAAR